MLRFLIVLGGTICLLGISGFANSYSYGALIVDQQQTTGTTGLSPIDPLLEVNAQSFRTGTGVTNVAGADLVLISGFASDITLELYDAIGIGATPLASASSGAQTPGSIRIEFDSPVLVASETTYYIVFNGAVGDVGFFGGTLTDQYSDGVAITNPNTASPTTFPTFDFAFATLTDDSVTAVPEPSSIGFCALAMMIGLRRGRRKSS